MSLLRRGLRMSEPAVERVQEPLGRLGDDRAGRKDRFGAGGFERRVVLRRHYAPTTIMMSPRPWLFSSALSCGTSVKCAAASEEMRDVDVVLDRLTRRLLGRREQRADIDVEAEIGKGGRDHFWPRSWPS